MQKSMGDNNVMFITLKSSKLNSVPD